MKGWVLVTGASGGIGSAIAKDVAEAGYPVVATWRSHEPLALRDEIVRLGGSCELLRLDIADRNACQTKLEVLVEAKGAPWGVVLDAGLCKDNVLAAMDGEDWDLVLHTNLDGFYNVMKPLVLPMCRARKGRVVVISSVSGVMGNRGQVNYSASKAGLIGAAKALAAEVASRSITVNCIAPGIIDTPMIQGLPVDELKKVVPMRRIGRPEEVASLAVFLLGEGAGYITRQVIGVNGGMI